MKKVFYPLACCLAAGVLVSCSGQKKAANVSRAVSSKAAIPALEGVLIKAYDNSLNISGYNLMHCGVL